MQHAVLGPSGLVVSRPSLGAMTFGGRGDANPIWKTGEGEANALVACALDHGVNFFDTADAYADGESERVLGAALRPVRNDVVITTKVGFRTGQPILRAGLGRRHITWSVDQSLQRLDTDWIDVLLAHRDDPLTPLEEVLAGLDAVVRSGKVRHIGFSNWPAWKIAAAIVMQRANGLAQFTHGQVYWSLVGRDVEHEILPMARHFGIGLTVWSPLAGGYLSGKYRRDATVAAEDRRARFEFPPVEPDRGFATLEIVRAIATELDRTPAQVALAWLLAKPSVTSIVVGASKVDQLTDNLGAADLVLDAGMIQRLDEVSSTAKPYPNWWFDIMNRDQILQDLVIGPAGS